MGTFEGAVDPGIKSFGQFKEFAAQKLDPAKHKKIAMFCTGGIRCEKASAYLLAQGFDEVYHLKGGILRYLEGVPEQDSRWRGECFVFDERVALGHGLRERQDRTMAPMSDINALSERIDALEMRLTYQDVTIETLNQTITAQWTEIDKLTRQLAELKERLREAESNAVRSGERTAAALLNSQQENGLPRRPLSRITRGRSHHPCIVNQTVTATATATITAHTTGETFLLCRCAASCWRRG